jgi:hypothetical protein
MAWRLEFRLSAALNKAKSLLSDQILVSSRKIVNRN